jgi:hypothetical protein
MEAWRKWYRVGMHGSVKLSIRFTKSIIPYGFGKEAVLSPPGK